MKRRIGIAVVVMGFSGLLAEIVLLRELLIVFSGNELSIGIILANWLIVEALGCFFAGRMVEKSKNTLEAFTVITVLFSISLLTAVLLTRMLKSLMGVSIGESIGLLPIFYSSLLVLLPVSLLHGALFTFSCHLYATFSAQDASAAGRVYVYETVGTIIGGIVCTYLLIPYLNTVQALIGLAILNFVVCLVLLAPYWKAGLLQRAMLMTLSMLIFVSGSLVYTGQASQLHRSSIQRQWKNLNVVHYQNSQYGNICVVENQGQYIYFLDGQPTLITPIPDIPFVEEFVHLPLLAHPEPKRILILSGGAGGMIGEVLKHPLIEAIEYAELDPLLLDLLRQFSTPLTASELADERVSTRYLDGHLLLKTTPNRYDVIFVGITEPSNLQTNRFFTREFFSLADQRLNEGGILVLGVPGSLTLLNDDLRNLNSCLYHTLSSVFPYVRVIPGDGTSVFLASRSSDIAAINMGQIVRRLDERNIRANVMAPWHIENKLHPGWQDWFARFREGSSQKINRDFQPLGLFYSIAYWNALHAPSFGWLFRQFERINLAVVFLLLAPFILYPFLRPWTTRSSPPGIPLAIATTGFAGMTFDLVVIFAFQSVYGYVFSWIGLLVASLMAGAACGAMLIVTVLGRVGIGLRSFIRTELAIICVAVALPAVFFAINTYGTTAQGVLLFSRGLFLAISFICGCLVGAQFPLANKLYLKNGTSPGRIAGLLYASDLMGGWLGGMVGAVVLLPVLGLTGTCITVGLLKLVSLSTIVAQSPSASAAR